MKQKAIFFLVIILAATLVSCDNTDFKRTRSGLLYKIFPGGNKKDSLPRPGDVLKFNVETKLNDSVMYSSYGKMPGFSRVSNPEDLHYSPAELFSILREGDSLVAVSLVDTFLKRGMGEQLPPNAKKGDRIISTFKIIKVFRNDSIAKLDYDAENKKDIPRREKEAQEQQAKLEKEMAVEKEKEEKVIQAYLADKKITAQKTSKGDYVQILNQGQGEQADSGKYVSVRYKGSNFKGKVFDTNMDTSFHHPDLLNFTVGSGQMIQGFDDGLRLLKKGAHAFIYIPGALGFGAQAQSADLGAYENLIFDVTVVDVQDAPPPPKPAVQIKPITKAKGNK